MNGRALALAAAVMLAACSGPDPSDTATPAPKPTAAVAGDTIDCAIGGAQYFGRDCKVEETELDGAKVLVVHHPDGGFRRFEVLTDGHGLATADGAEEAVTSVANGELEVAVGADRYRFPATIEKHGGAE